MEMMTDNTKSILYSIGRAIEKGIGEDIRSYKENNNNAINNALPFVRGDFIITNIRNNVNSESVDIKYFRRQSWTVCIIIDRKDKRTYSICSRKNLERIANNTYRKSPHYLQTLINIENKAEKANNKQISIFDIDPTLKSQFADEEYENDFALIMEEALCKGDNCRHWVVVYEAERDQLIALSAVLLDGSFGVVDDVTLIDMIKPDFGSLTSVEKNVKDTNSLVSVKANLLGSNASEKEKHIEISAKLQNKSKEA